MFEKKALRLVIEPAGSHIPWQLEFIKGGRIHLA